MTTPVMQTTQVQATNLPNARVQGINATNPNAELEQQAGQALGNLGAQTAEYAARETMLANQVRVDSALNQVRAAQQHLTYDPEAGYLAQKGAAAIEPDDQGMRLDDNYTQKLQATISEAAGSLANDKQREVFAQHANDLTTTFSGQVQEHVFREAKNFGIETQQGTVALARQAAMQSWNDDVKVGAQIDSAKAATWKAGQIAGEPANLIEAKMKDVAAQIHSDVIKTALDSNNPTYAMAYLNRYKDELGDKLLGVYGQVNRQVQARAAAGASQLAGAQMHSQLNPSDFDRMANITKLTESGGNPNAIGPYIEGQGSAKGAMQVMPATGVNPGYGVKPAENDSPEELARVGRDYLAAMVNKYTDPKKAWAAYNAGPSTVDAAVKDGGKDWLAKMPKETQAYVQKNSDAYDAGAGRPPIPSQQEYDDKAVAALGPNPDPELVNMTLNETKRQYNEMLNQRKTNGENAVQQAQQWLIQNKGDFASMPSDLKNTITSSAPDKYDDIQNFAKHLAKPPVVDNMEAYHTVIAHPEELTHMDDATFQRFAMANFNEGTQKQIAKMREGLLSGKTNQSADSINLPALNTSLNRRLEQLGINSTPGKYDESGKKRIGTIQQFLIDAGYTMQHQIGRKMLPEEIDKFVDSTFAKNLEFRSAIFGHAIGDAKQMPFLSMKVSDIPTTEINLVKQSLANKGVSEPTDDQILRTYWNGKINAR
jgi:soluble lytic murein transglycosylase